MLLAVFGIQTYFYENDLQDNNSSVSKLPLETEENERFVYEGEGYMMTKDMINAHFVSFFCYLPFLIIEVVDSCRDF